ncbi:MAG: peptidoglycan-binding domain-containing protein [Rhodomicrobium sp.]
MTPARARFTVIAITAIFLATAGNALFLQDRSRFRMGTMPSTAVSVAQLPIEKAPDGAPSGQGGQPASPVPSKAGRGEPRLFSALRRELGQRGYAEQLTAQSNGLRFAVLAYEFDNGMPLTGEPTEALLKQVIFNVNQAPRGVFADRAEASPRFVMEAQKVLLGLGFFRGTLSGRMDPWTIGAVKDFERHRSLPITGRLSENTLLELIIYSGQSIQISSG